MADPCKRKNKAFVCAKLTLRINAADCFPHFTNNVHVTVPKTEHVFWNNFWPDSVIMQNNDN